MIIRGGTSKGAYFLAEDLPGNVELRDDLLMRIMGTPDARQIDGIGGAHPLTSKVAVVSSAAIDDADIEYLFLQVGVDQPEVSDRQNCGNLLAGVAPFAVERGLIQPGDGVASVRIHMLNTDSIATASFVVQNGHPVYAGDTSISGVPGSAAEIKLLFKEIAGSSSGALFPTGNTIDEIKGIRVTLVDNGMPVVVMLASDLGVTGYEACSELEANQDLRKNLEEIRLQAGEMMNLGVVSDTTIPKLTMVSEPRRGGSVSTRTFIPHRCHQAIGVLGAVSAATGCVTEGSVGQEVLANAESRRVLLEHPTGSFEVFFDSDGNAGIIRTARKLMDGIVFPRSA